MTFEERPTPIMAAAGFFLWFLMLSAALVETDAYRVGAVIVAGYGIWVYHRTRPQPGISFMAWYCFFWAQYVIARFLYGYFNSGNFEHGSSEWLFAFPLFFGGIGIGLTRMRFHVEKMLLFFFAVAALLLAASQHWWVMASGRAVSPLYHNNQIHGAVAAGLILIGAFYWFAYYAARGFRQAPPYGMAAAVLAPVVIGLCLISIIGSQSKGVWMALAGTLPVAVLLHLFLEPRGSIRLAVFALVGTVGAFAALFHERLWARAGATVMAAWDLMTQMVVGRLPATTILEHQIASDAIPYSLKARLEIWYNAFELFEKAPFFGHGNFWIEKWEQTRYANVGFYLMHNGYLEILVRHGLFGFLALAVMLGVMIAMVWRGWRKGFIPLAGLQAYLMLLFFFGLTLLSNSNNRLAIGESLALLTGGIAFYAQAMERYSALQRKPDAPVPAEA